MLLVNCSGYKKNFSAFEEMFFWDYSKPQKAVQCSAFQFTLAEIRSKPNTSALPSPKATFVVCIFKRKHPVLSVWGGCNGIVTLAHIRKNLFNRQKILRWGCLPACFKAEKDFAVYGFLQRRGSSGKKQRKRFTIFCAGVLNPFMNTYIQHSSR